MKIQALDLNTYNKKMPSVNKSVSHKGNYNEVMKNIARRDLQTANSVASAMQEAFTALINDADINKSPYLTTRLSTWLRLFPRILLEELFKPKSKVDPSLKSVADIIENRTLNLCTGEYDTAKLCIYSTGKHGIFNSIFKNENANNKVFINYGDKFEVSTDKNGNMIAFQSPESGFTVKNVYDYFGQRIKKETVSSSDVVVPGF